MPFADIKKWITDFPLLDKIIRLEPVAWLNPSRKDMAQIHSLPVNKHDMEDAAALWERFAPYLSLVFPETKESKGIIESPLVDIPKMQALLSETGMPPVFGRLMLKCDNALPIAGSIKARGSFYEVLHYAEQLALQQGMIQPGDNYRVFAEEKFKQFFKQYAIGVGSTGNLGLGIGIISAQLGFRVSVYMSTDAKEWKKKLLRERGATVIEVDGDFSAAVREGRNETIADPKGYFVDDENSKYLFLGYSVAALRLQKQLEDLKIKVDADHPLIVYSPCGIGGSPGGIAFGLRQVFGDNAHSFFVEPTHAPAVLVGLVTGKMEKVSVQDFGIDNRTEADGLAVGRPSAFASTISKVLISGIYTIEDDTLFRLLYMLGKTEQIFLEPSATAGLVGPQRIATTNYLLEKKIDPANCTHIVWATGGALVPPEDRAIFYQKGERLFKEKKQVV